MTAAGREDARIVRAMPIVDRIVRRCGNRFPSVDRDEMGGVGREALLAAQRDFDPTHGASFEEFAWVVVYRAILRFALREVRRAARLRPTQLERAGERPPTEISFEEGMDMTPEKARAQGVPWLQQQAAMLLVSSVSVVSAEGPEHALEAATKHEAVHRAIATLDEEQQRFVARFYRDEATIPALATEMGVSERTVQRLHARVRERLVRALTRDKFERT